MSSRKIIVSSSKISQDTDTFSGSKTSQTKHKKKMLIKSEDKTIMLFGSESKPITIKKKRNSKKKIDDNNFDDRIEEIIQTLQENYVQQKKLMNELKELKTLHKKEMKLITNKSSDKKSGKNSGFNKPQPVPEKLCKLLEIDDTHLSRSAVTSLMYQYFQTNNMYNTKTKKEIIPNKEIRKIFGMREDDIMNFYNFQTWLKKLYQQQVPELASSA